MLHKLREVGVEGSWGRLLPYAVTTPPPTWKSDVVLINDTLLCVALELEGDTLTIVRVL